jgi:hypothetical protein
MLSAAAGNTDLSVLLPILQAATKHIFGGKVSLTKRQREKRCIEKNDRLSIARIKMFEPVITDSPPSSPQSQSVPCMGHSHASAKLETKMSSRLRGQNLRTPNQVGMKSSMPATHYTLPKLHLNLSDIAELKQNKVEDPKMLGTVYGVSPESPLHDR